MWIIVGGRVAKDNVIKTGNEITNYLKKIFNKINFLKKIYTL